ncbi:hypothetical protein [Nocardia sp. NPDC057030]|uniref:hypothetical protein n=1 Tax=unclassified Nocardia TaxID=2637762 RepID=UPI00362B46A5
MLNLGPKGPPVRLACRARWRGLPGTAVAEPSLRYQLPLLESESARLLAAPTTPPGRWPETRHGWRAAAMVEARDVGATAAVIAAAPEQHAGRTYLLTGPT